MPEKSLPENLISCLVLAGPQDFSYSFKSPCRSYIYISLQNIKCNLNHKQNSLVG